MDRYKKSYANKLMNEYIEELEAIKRDICKNFQDMDLTNASVQNEMEEIIGYITWECDSLISAIESRKL